MEHKCAFDPQEFGQLQGMVKQLEGDMGALNVTIHGNGKPGIKSDLYELKGLIDRYFSEQIGYQKAQEEHRQETEKRSEQRHRWQLAIAVALLTSMLGLLTVVLEARLHLGKPIADGPTKTSMMSSDSSMPKEATH